MGKTIIPIQSDKIGKDGIHMILETLGRVMGMSPYHHDTMQMDIRLATLGRFWPPQKIIPR